MKIDFHFHTCLTKGIPFDHDYFLRAAARAREVELDALCITDHLENAAFERIYATLDERHSYQGHYYLVEGVRFYPGVEVEVREGPHLLALGTREAVLLFAERLQGQRSAHGDVPVSRYFEAQAELELMNIVAHPRRPGREVERLDGATIARFDAFDLNAKDLWRLGEGAREVVEALAASYGRPLVTGSDTHHFLQLGSVWNEFERPFESVAELRGLVRAGAYARHVHPELAEWVELAQETKRAIKQARYGIVSTKYD